MRLRSRLVHCAVGVRVGPVVRANASAAIRAGTQCQQGDYRGWDAGVMHGLLSAAMAPVMADLRATGGPLPMVDDEDWVDDPEYASAMLRGPDGRGFGITVRLAAAECDRIASVARTRCRNGRSRSSGAGRRRTGRRVPTTRCPSSRCGEP